MTAPGAPDSRASFGRPLRWLEGYRQKDVGRDALAGLTLAAYAVPVSMAYAGLAGLPPQVGLYCYLAAGIGYVLIGASRQLALGPTSAVSLLLGSALLEQGHGDSARIAALASATAVFVAVLCFAAWLLRLSQLVTYISETNLLGFKAGAALVIISTQLPKLSGTAGGGDGFGRRVAILVTQLPEANPWVVAVGAAALALLWLGERYAPRFPAALAVVALGVAASSFLPLAAHGVKLSGDLPAGLPVPALPAIGLSDIDGLTELAIACFLLSFVESIAAARTFAAAHGYAVDARRELLALGAANLASGLGQGYVVAGGLSQSAVNDKAGARSPLSLLFTSGAMAIVLLFLTGLLARLPQAVLGAIVLMAVKGLIDLPAMRRLRTASPIDFRVAIIAFLGVLTLGILRGVLIATVAALALVVHRASRPAIAFLGRIPGTNRFSDIDLQPENEPLPGVLPFRVLGALLYFNAEHVTSTVLARARKARPRVVLWDLSTTLYTDVPGARAIHALKKDLAALGATLQIAEAGTMVRNLLREEGLEEELGPLDHRVTLEEALAKLVVA